jgi:16S rRNA (uracil1498-N3)-methyltransferase
MRYFFIDPGEATGSAVTVRGSDANHMKNVLRLQPGDKIRLLDGTGFEYDARITRLSSNQVDIAIIHRFPSAAESTVEIIIAQAFLKEKKMDGLVRRLTELGVTRWIPFVADRSVSRPDAGRLSGRKQRWEKIAREAVKQCRRGRIPEIGDTLSFETALHLGKGSDLKIVFWENESKPLSFPDRRFNRIFAVMGPEGGLTSREIETAKSLGFITASLGPRILRADTATIAAVALIQYLFGDMGQKIIDKNSGFE